MTKIYRLVSRNANEIRFADPDAFQNTCTVRVKAQPKKAGNMTVYNVRSNVNLQRTVDVGTPAVDACSPKNQERISANLMLSGSTVSRDEMQTLLSDLHVAIDLFKDDFLKGFTPLDDTLDLAVVPTP